jgi:hypothetical protein
VNKGRVTTIILFAVLGVLLLIFFFYNSGDEKRYQWYESYRADSDQPYGTLFIKKLLKSYRPDEEFIVNDRKSLKDLLDSTDTKINTDYVFIGQSMHLTNEDAEALAFFIYDGNDAFIASLEIPETIVSKIHGYECEHQITYETNYEESVVMNFYHDTLKTAKGFRYTYRYGTDDNNYYWNSVANEVFCSASPITALGHHTPDHVNFIKIPYGSGNLYLHSNPIAFTNYFLTKSEKADYAASVFSHLNGKNMIWDEYSNIPFLGNNNSYNSPLYYILQQPTLKYAWWLMLISIVLYVLFAAKRTQRVIPVLEAKTNTSLEFIHLISSLHYQNGNHLDMARKKMKYFLYFIRSKYGIQAQTFKEEHIIKLAEKSKVSQADVESIFRQYHLIERNSNSNIDVNRLLDLFNSIENFYKQCK